jgi:phosphoglycolate phosphatase
MLAKGMTDAQTFIFDLDGTLIDSAPDIHFAANAALAAIHRPALDLATVTSFIGAGVEILMSKCLDATGGDDPDTHARALEVLLRVYTQEGAARTTCYPGVVACLERLCARGMKLGICTNKVQDAANAVCQELDLEKYFVSIHGARDTVAKKPAPDALFNCIADVGGVPDRMLYVGDSHIDQKTAQNAGIPFAFFTGGYLNHPLSGEPPHIRFDDWSSQWLDT